MSDDQLFEPSAAAKARAKVNAAQYEEMYARSVADPDGFWAEQAKRIDWIKPPTRIKNTSFAYPDVSIKWFEDGVLNVSANCIDRHLPTRADQVAIIWEGDDPGTDGKTSPISELHDEVCRFANVLKAHGRQEGRPRHHLHADDPRGGVRDARLRAHRRGAFGDLRRLLAGLDRGPHQRLRQPRSSSPPTRAGAAARLIPLKKNVDEALPKAPGVDHGAGGQEHRQRRGHEGRPRRLVRDEAAAGCRPIARPSR